MRMPGLMSGRINSMNRQVTSSFVPDASRSQPRPAPCEADIRAQLHCILASRDFSAPDRLRRFLSYVIEETLAGRADRIKAYSIAVEVFGRDANIDILNDPVVRIEAGRLRRALERYYFLEGKTDRVLIEIPKGSYVPSFAWRLGDQLLAQPLSLTEPQPLSQPRPDFFGWLRRPWLIGSVTALAFGTVVTVMVMGDSSRPAASSTSTPGLSLLVKPFVNLSPTPDAGVFAAGLSEEMLSQLATFQGLTIVRSEASDDLAQRSSAARRQLGARHILEGMIRAADNKLRITSRLVDGETAAIRWSAVYEADLHSGNIIDLESGVAQKIAAAVAQAIRIPRAASKVR